MIRTVRGKRYLLVIIDRFSRWVEAVPSADQGAQTVIKFLTREVIPRFGIPSQISSDNGSAFIQRTVKTVIQQLRIKQRLGCVYHPQSQGLVERVNGTLKAKFNKICADTKLNWVDALPLALMSYRMQTNRITNLTPHEMLTGRPMPVPYLRGPYEGPLLLQIELRAYMKQITAIHEAINAQEQSRGPREEEETPGAIQPGDQVYLRVFRRRWNEPRREGPYTVVRATPTAVQVEGSTTWYHLTPLADYYWVCGGKRLRATLPKDWKGMCTRVRMLQEITLIEGDLDEVKQPQPKRRRAKRAYEKDLNVSIDIIGQPRGIPEEYKARNEIKSGFESIWIWITPNKNLEWINYIYYNQQRFINYTDDALEALGKQLGPTSKMTWQNRQALNWLLAEKGGVCVMFGSDCCTYIPNNTAPDGSFTKAMGKLKNLREEVTKNAGADMHTWDWFNSLFGSWGQWLTKMGIIIGIVVVIFLLLFSCIVPFVMQFNMELLFQLRELFIKYSILLD